MVLVLMAVFPWHQELVLSLKEVPHWQFWYGNIVTSVLVQLAASKAEKKKAEAKIEDFTISWFIFGFTPFTLLLQVLLESLYFTITSLQRKDTVCSYADHHILLLVLLLYAVSNPSGNFSCWVNQLSSGAHCFSSHLCWHKHLCPKVPDLCWTLQLLARKLYWDICLVSAAKYKMVQAWMDCKYSVTINDHTETVTLLWK